jgi:U3 small nucleolar RNA-associated protein 18
LTEDEDLVDGKEYTKRLRRQFERLYPVPDWALPPKSKSKKKKRRASESEDSEDGGMDVEDDDLVAQPLAKLLQSTAGFTRRDGETEKRPKLRPEVLDIQRLKDIPGHQPSAIDCLSFHPHHPVILSSGPSSLISLHHFAPTATPPFPLLTSLHIRSTPISTALIHATGTRLFFAGRRRYFHVWDLASGSIEKITKITGHAETQRSMERFKLSPCGRWMGLVGSSRKGGGEINILDADTLQWIAAARVEGRGGIADFCWWRNGEGLSVVSKAGEVSEWDINQRAFVGSWFDEGAVGTTVLALGGTIRDGGDKGLGGDRWVAIGSSSGVVNVYDRHSWRAGDGGVPNRPKPKRVLEQLVTPISHLHFSPDGQILAFASRWKRDALKLGKYALVEAKSNANNTIVHLPSCTVYRNWPTSNTPMGRITSVAFSPGSDTLAIGNEQGKIRLWEIRA